jgi:glycosyltransferase involved in cell wall biosynthesis
VNVALTVYPLSSGFRQRLEHSLDKRTEYLSLSELRTASPARALSRLRTLKGTRLLLPLEDETSRCILPLLKAVAGLSNAEQVEVRYPDMRAERVTRGELVRGLGALAHASAASRLDALRCGRELRTLAAAPRTEPAPLDDQRALYLNANLWFGVKAGGSVGHVAGVVNALKERGRDVVYVSAGGRPMIRADVPLLALQPPSVFGMPYELNYYRFHRDVVRQLEYEQAPSFIYQRMSVANYAGVTLSRRWGVPLVLEYNGSEAWIAKNWGRALRYHDLAVQSENVCLRHAHLVVTVSDVLRDELIEKGVAAERIVSYPNCIDPAVFDPARFTATDRASVRRTHGIADDAVLVTFVGTFGQWHGVEVLAETIARLVKEDQSWLAASKVHFLLVGDGLKMPLVREILGKVDASRFVTLAGLVPQAEAPAYLAASDVLVSPHVANADGSRFFGSPTKLFEYMAMGKAIVASDLDQIGEVLQNSLRTPAAADVAPAAGESRLAVLVSPGDVASLARGLKFAVERADWRAVLGTNARAEALARYTWAHHVDAILERLRVVVR